MYYSLPIFLGIAVLSALISAEITTYRNQKHCINCEAKYGKNAKSWLRSDVNENIKKYKYEV